jgi:uracil-DNA glycosylase
VAAVAINLNEAWGLLIEYEITEHTFRSLRAGHSGGSLRPSKFGSRAGRSLAALVQASNGEAVTEVNPEALPELLDQTARLQLVKCSPWKRARSYPTPAMLSNCPDAYLAEELSILKPGAVLALGTKARSELIRLGARLHNEGSGLWVGTLQHGDGKVDVYSTYHPAAYGNRWRRCYDRLVDYLATAHR